MLNLSAGVDDPARTLEQYVVTPQLVDCFDDALGFIRSAVDSNTSKACYLHGSFGSGKSHFMAVLNLLLRGNTEVRSVPELAPVCEKHRWAEDRKFLLVPYHMIGARSMESAILGGYVDHVRKVHPDAPLPGVYHADDIFENARQFRADLGDEKFFGKLNAGGSQAPEGGNKGWGKLAGWGADRFERALTAGPGDPERVRLVGRLVETVLPAYRGVAQGKEEAYVDLDEGLATVSAHARELGYDGLVLFLDELILWLASNSGNLDFVQREGNKLAKLVESRRADRPVPVISFVARQRDLRDLIGEHVTGAESLNFSDVLSHWEGRFHQITLEDRNLPVIAERRVLKPKSEAARAELDRAFEQTAEIRREVLKELMTREADRAMFRQVYPFSPVLIQALVAVSSTLQRERTALKIMLQLLVNRRDTLRLGEVIPLGDLWDVVAHGDEAFSDVMRVRFENAKKLYAEKLRPMLVQQHDVDPEADRDGGGETAAKLRQFDGDDRLVKSLLLSSLVQGVEALRNMTPEKLAALNHGSIRSRIPGREPQIVLSKLRNWAGLCGELRVDGDGPRPTVSLELEGVDTSGLIRSAAVYDNAGNRKARIRRMLFASLGVADRDTLQVDREVEWRGTRRPCEVVFANVRELPDESLRAGDGWKLILDFPFDTEGRTPNDDFDRLAKFRDGGESERTLVWLPSFFSSAAQGELGKLVAIDHLLRGTTLDQHAQHLSQQDRETARMLLKNQRSALEGRLKHVLEAAYAVRTDPPAGTLDGAYDLSDRHFQSLDPSFSPRAPVGATLGEAADRLLQQAFDHQYPDHPKFGRPIKKGKDLQQVLDHCREAARQPDGRLFVEDRAARKVLRDICDPLDLGRMSETHFVLGDFWKNHFNKRLTAAGGSDPTAGEVRRWIDEPAERGMPDVIRDLLVIVYADQTDRSFVRLGQSHEPKLGDLPGDVQLIEQRLPDEAVWGTAVRRAGELFGLAVPPLRSASNLAQLSESVRRKIAAVREDCEALPDRLLVVMRDVGVPPDEVESADRLRTAEDVRGLLGGCASAEPTELAEELPRTEFRTSPEAAGRSMAAAGEVRACLGATKWDLFKGVAGLEGERATEATLLLDDVRSWLRADELAVTRGLRSNLAAAEDRAVALLARPTAAGEAIAEQGAGATDVPGSAGVAGHGAAGVDSGDRTGLGFGEADPLLKSLGERLRNDPGLRLDLSWSLSKVAGAGDGP